MKKRSRRRLVLNFIITFLGFFFLSGMVTTSSLMLFLHSLTLPEEHIKQVTPFTFFNLCFISIIFALVGTIWKKLTVEKPVDDINKVLLRIKKGDFSAKLSRRFYPSRFSTIVNNINLMTTELSSLDGLKVSLMSNISHELKTPLSVISNYATILQDTSLPDEKRIEYAKSIAESSKKMTELVTNILKLNQLENQNIPSDIKEYDLSEQLCECLLEFEDIWEKRDIEIETEIDEDIKINSNEHLLRIVWTNLLSNAFKFTPANGTVTVTLSQTNKYAVVKISDTGCGIPPEQTELIFDKFYQCDTSRATDGNGLGLALVKRIINITDSIIKVESEIGSGTTFTVKIPKK